MDELVLRGMAKWPDVPAVFGWLELDARGNWLVKGKKITNPAIVEFIGRNYAHDGHGRWFFQNGPQRVFTLLHDARPVLINLGEPGGLDITPWADRVQMIDTKYAGPWELPVLGAVTAPTAVLIRPDGYVAWVGDQSQLGLAEALTTWFGPPAAA